MRDKYHSIGILILGYTNMVAFFSLADTNGKIFVLLGATSMIAIIVYIWGND